MASRIDQEHVNACKPLDQWQSAATYIELASVQHGLEFLLGFLEMADNRPQDIESYCIPGMYDLIQHQFEKIYKAVLIVCPEIDKAEAESIQKEIEINNTWVFPPRS